MSEHPNPTNDTPTGELSALHGTGRHHERPGAVTVAELVPNPRNLPAGLHHDTIVARLLRRRTASTL